MYVCWLVCVCAFLIVTLLQYHPIFYLHVSVNHVFPAPQEV